ncbi:MAG TPA: thrombospondin type 3 repeat-containing protein [Acidimicrobiales bacterium]|nr:thrombospondin type 3 repeat-containing protein [Acidimicrobiales bacterium]
MRGQTTDHPPSTRRRTGRRHRWPALAVTALLAAGLAAPTPAGAEGPDRPEEGRTEARERLVSLKLCDLTGCYVAWRVVDSDHDGVSDADELMAGTDPHDPASFPPLQHVAELAEKRELPSFEAGLGTFLLFPPEIVELISKRHDNSPLGAFPALTRKDALTRMGISTDLLAESGVDIERGGLTIGLDGLSSGDGLAGMRVGGVRVDLISAGSVTSTMSSAHGGVKSSEPINGGTGTFTTYNDGHQVTWESEGQGRGVGTETNADGSPGNTTIIQDSPPGTSPSTTTEAVQGPDGQPISETTTTALSSDAGTTILTVKVEYQRDDKGNVTGTVVTTTYTASSSDGSFEAMAETVESCDAGGGNCTELSSTYVDSDGVSTDDGTADDGTADDGEVDDDVYTDTEALPIIITEEVVGGVLRRRGAAVNVVEGWRAPGNDDPTDHPDPGTIMLVDGDLAQASSMLLDPLRVTEAQPETRPGLPNPGVGAPGGGAGGGCGVLCMEGG